ncbi:NAD(P)/FAD-dependent oxidoreductase [Aliiroseovarius sp. S253]|uniref:NAD(P)/FAD-dependent oxidoreductase n=1 Tax=Aliiroseovarius sp. S253 TaxID=3415133 RepID=UPI003C7A4F5F
MSDEITIIGAGIIGVSIGLELARRGQKVRVLDRKGVAGETSAGNAGAFAFQEIEPLAKPGIMKQAPKWLLDPLGPLSVPPAYAVQIAPWMIRLWRASWRDRYEGSMKAQAELMHVAKAAFERQVAHIRRDDLIQRKGQMALYEGEKAYRSTLPAWALKKEHGFDAIHLTSPEAIAEYQPGLHPRFTHGAFTPNWFNTVDPKLWTETVAQALRDAGGEIQITSVKNILPTETGVRIDTDEGPIETQKLIVAAGAWSHHLARLLGDKIPLETERGYNTTLPPGAFDLRTHLTFSQHGFVASVINGGVRIGGAVELGGLKLPPNFKRADVLLKKAKAFMPGLNTDGGTQWMGYRPSLPDTLPVIGASPKDPRVLYAFGHGHLGLTQSAGTAELIAALVFGETPGLGLDAFAPTRF